MTAARPRGDQGGPLPLQGRAPAPSRIPLHALLLLILLQASTTAGGAGGIGGGQSSRGE